MVTVILIVINVLLWLYQMLLEKNGFEVAADYGLLSWRFMNARHLPKWQGGLLENAIMPLVTSMFMHSSSRHLISNSCFLWIFGENIEKCFGHARFLGFYLACGIGASLVHVILDPNSMSPIIGASGAIAGLAGAELLTFPRSKVRITLVSRSLQIPACLFIVLFFFGGFLINAALSYLIPEAKPSSIGHFLHAGGFASGILLVIIARRASLFTGSRCDGDGSASLSSRG